MPRPRRALAILDVGHGNCAVLADSRGTVVIDAGPGSSLLEYLTEQKIKHVDVVFLSHADKDHIGGLAQLFASKAVKISRICLNCDASKGSEIWDDLVYELSKANNAGELQFDTSLVRDESGQHDQGNVHIEILAPSKYLAAKGVGSTDQQGRKLTSNSLSAVIRLSQHGEPLVILPGDIDEIGLDDLLDNKIDTKAPVLVFPHHGGRSGSGKLDSFVRKVCDLVSPSSVLFSVARGREKHPLPEVVALVRHHLKNVRIACTQLSEHCARVNPQQPPTHIENVFAQGREKRRCCAGTFLIHLTDPTTLNPILATHRAFIDSHAPTALCRKS